jgi:hypothetical protein
MPQIPILIPVIVTGLLVGSVMANEGRRISKKKLGTASVLSGILNGAQAYLVNYLAPQTTFRITTGTGTTPGSGNTAFPTTLTSTAATALRQFSEQTYFVSCVVVGILIPLVILGIAMFRSRSKGGEEEIEEIESEESALEN